RPHRPTLLPTRRSSDLPSVAQELFALVHILTPRTILSRNLRLPSPEFDRNLNPGDKSLIVIFGIFLFGKPEQRSNGNAGDLVARSEEHTSELQSRGHLV